MKSLKKWLLINALFSFLCGLTSLIFYSKLGQLIGINDTSFFLSLRLSLLLFVVFLIYTTYKQLGNKLLINSIIIMDFAWVIVSLIVVAFRLFDLTNTGYVIILVVALFIALFGQRQSKSNQYVHKN